MMYPGLKGAPPPLCSIFISKVQNGDAKKVKRHITSKHSYVKDVELVSHKGAVFKSFKITLYKDDISELLSDKFWPQGI